MNGTTRWGLAPLLCCSAVALAMPSRAWGFEHLATAGREGEIDIETRFVGRFGQLEPTERPTTFQSADVKLLTGGVGYTVGDVGPLRDLYLRVQGSYYTAGAEAVEDPDDDLPLGHPFFEHDRGETLTATVAANFVHEPRFDFGLFLQGTLPLGVDLEKFSNIHVHYVVGGAAIDLALSNPGKLFHLAYASRIWGGSGAYRNEGQHNAALAMSNLFRIEAAWWLLPWRAGVSFGPYFEADLNAHTNSTYRAAYASVTPDLVAGDEVRAVSLAMAVLPFFQVTEHAMVEIGFVQTLLGYDVQSTQEWTGSVRASF